MRLPMGDYPRAAQLSCVADRAAVKRFLQWSFSSEVLSLATNQGCFWLLEENSHELIQNFHAMGFDLTDLIAKKKIGYRLYLR